MISSDTNRQIISFCTFMVGCFSCYVARDIITTGQNISDGSDYLESPEKKFQMGFFSREESSEVRRYVGVWYTMDPKTVVWVANRDKPVLDSTGVLAVSEEGSLKLLDGNGVEYFSTETGSIIYSSYGKSKPETEKRLLAIVIVVIVTALVISTFCGISYILFKILVKRSENNQRSIEVQSSDLRRRITDLLDLDHSKEDDKEGIDVPYFELESIMTATDDFSEKNRLGEGGFGPVYKGKLPGGKEIAVKRLSSLSGQGLQEFKNEVMLIAKLQHRNLVRLLGYCIVGDEKMLLYEYMPNRSLDKFIFDRTMCTSLGWEMRFNIIMGIARGLNYLHHDSRLRVIHRDLKTSNILLDEDMNPKISDFGLAKIVQGKDLEATTDRVMGTFGYMSPEYALDGLFSIKSDVFSFGVVMLEIISGKRNIGFYQSRRSISLLGHAWNLWKEDKPFELMDQILMESCKSSEVLKCIIVGLLCVQGDLDDRPNMTNVILMLSGDIVTLPSPKEPAFIPGRDYVISSSSSSSKTNTQSKNMLTITKLDGR
ncbi:G-type lectin S-receptor-like serine/threonine-protein kinase At4g03230 isoform X4 [Lactuca sativa]|uniref:G-type lectin S-receptor-like serine/threonine-protein kinase At4g03230 isoform X4 n=1 Tax=Lactuca sativa TaxID=4236 RepID=UPI001C6896D3|nr:G-type lectin S-receptor-like serine/threonine-protein kinase At4g03230 isoform X4 [Lactuca sativa]